MKKYLSIALTIALLMTFMLAIPVATAATATSTVSESPYTFTGEFVSLAEICNQLFVSEVYPAGLMSVELVFTETFSVRLDVEVDGERVIYYILEPHEWSLWQNTVLVHESVLEFLLNPSL